MYPLRSLFPHLFLSIAHVPRYLWIQIIDLIDYEGGMKSVPNPPLSKMMVLPQPAGCCNEKKNVPGSITRKAIQPATTKTNSEP